MNNKFQSPAYKTKLSNKSTKFLKIYCIFNNMGISTRVYNRSSNFGGYNHKRGFKLLKTNNNICRHWFGHIVLF